MWMANIQPNPVVTSRSKAWVYDRSLAGIAGSNSAEGMDVCLLWVLCVVHVQACATGWSLVQGSHLVCLSRSMIRGKSHLLHLRWGGRAGFKRDGTWAETIFGLSAKRTSPFKLLGRGGQFSRLLAAEVSASAVVEQVWNVMAHAQKPYLVFQRNGRVHLNCWGGGVSSVDYWQPRWAHQR